MNAEQMLSIARMIGSILIVIGINVTEEHTQAIATVLCLGMIVYDFIKMKWIKSDPEMAKTLKRVEGIK